MWRGKYEKTKYTSCWGQATTEYLLIVAAASLSVWLITGLVQNKTHDIAKRGADKVWDIPFN